MREGHSPGNQVLGTASDDDPRTDRGESMRKQLRFIVPLLGMLLWGCAKKSVEIADSTAESATATVPGTTTSDTHASVPQSSGTTRDATNSSPRNLPIDATGTFAFSQDESGRLLDQLLPPRGPSRLPPAPSQGPTERTPMPAIWKPTLGLPMQELSPPSIGFPSRALVRPALPMETMPAEVLLARGDLPQRDAFPLLPVVRVYERNPHETIPLPTLAKPSIDRASLEDPTGEFSWKQTYGAAIPYRTNTAPYQRIDLPNPFEFAENLRVQPQPAELSNFPLFTMPKP